MNADTSERAILIIALTLESPRRPAETERLRAEEFKSASYGRIWSATCSSWSDGLSPDAPTVRSKLEASGVDDGALVEELAKDYANPNLGHHVAEVKRAHRLRTLAGKLSAIAFDAAEPGASPSDLETRTVAAIDQQVDGEKPGAFKPLKALFGDELALMERRSRGELTDNGRVKSGFSALDDKLGGGFPRGAVTVIAARPSMGKSSLARAIAIEQLRAGKRVLFVALESGEMEWRQVFLAALARVPVDAVANADGRNLAVASRLYRAVEEAKDWKLELRADGPMDLASIRASILLAHQRAPVDTVIIDYLQLIKANGKHGSREQQVAESSRGMVELARDTGAWVCAAAQLNRESERRSDHRPSLGDLRESGSIESDANQVLLIHREGYYDQSIDPTAATIAVAKNRNGPVGPVELKADLEFCTFSSASSAGRG
jgi:replicative DNA helicase